MYELLDIVNKTTSQTAPLFNIDTESPPQQPLTREERLPFTVRLVRSEQELAQAVHIRHSAYARHVPEFAETLREAEASDKEPGVAILLAQSKLDGEALGTMRIQTNAHKPLSLEQSVQLPQWLQGRTLAEATRLGVAQQNMGRLVKTALFKSFFLYCKNEGIEWMVIAGRAPIDRMYERLLFSDVYPGMGFIPLQHANNMPHRVMSFEVGTAEQRWAAVKHPLFDYIFRTHHPDLQLDKLTRQRGQVYPASVPVWLS